MHPTQTSTQNGDGPAFASTSQGPFGDGQTHFNTIIEPRYSPTFRDSFNINSVVHGAIFRPTFNPTFERCFNLDLNVQVDQSYHESSRNHQHDPDRSSDTSLILQAPKRQPNQDATKCQNPCHALTSAGQNTTTDSSDGGKSRVSCFQG